MRFFSSAEPATGSFVWMPDNYLHKKDEDALIFCDILVFSVSYFYLSVILPVPGLKDTDS